MCTYATQHRTVTGSGKGAAGWFPLSTATVYFDHPVHAAEAHTLNIDFAAPERGPAARVAVELEAGSAMQLMSAIADALVAAPAEISGLSAAQLALLRVLTSDA